jgi:hypothetical protein
VSHPDWYLDSNIVSPHPIKILFTENREKKYTWPGVLQKPTTLQEEYFRPTQWDKINIKAKEYMYVDTKNKPSHRYSSDDIYSASMPATGTDTVPQLSSKSSGHRVKVGTC